MDPGAAVDSIHEEEIRTAADPKAKRKELLIAYRENQASPYTASERGYVDEVIEPAESRIKVAEALAMLDGKSVDAPERKHGNIPL